MKRATNCLHNNNGSALVTVFMVLMVLLVLGMGLMALSVGSAKQTVVTDTYEKLYYPAEGSSTQGVDFVKSQALASYNNLAKDMQSGFEPTENKFYQYINDRVLGSLFVPAQLEKETTSPGSKLDGLDVDISAPGSGNPRIYTITSEASGPSLSRTVIGQISIKYVPPQKKFQPFGPSPLIVGGTLDLSGVKNNTVLEVPAGVETNTIAGASGHYSGTTYPLTHETEWVLNFSDFTQPVITTVDQAPKNNDTISNLTKSVAWNIVGENGARFTLNGVKLNNGGAVVCSDTGSGGLELKNCVLNNVTIISKGDLSISGCTITNSDIFCEGVMTIDEGSINKSSIISKGNITFNGGTITNSSVFCGGTFTIGNGTDNYTGISNSLVYTMYAEVGRQGNGKTEVVSGLFYSYHDLTVNGNKYGYFTGQVVTNGSTYLTDDIPNKTTFFYTDENLMNNLPSNAGILGSNPFKDTLSDLNGGSLYTIIQPVMSEIIISQNIGEQ